MSRLTRHDLKKDEFRSTYEGFERFVKENYKQIAAVTGILAVVVGSALGLKLYMDWQEQAAAAELATALRTFRAYVGAPSAAGGPLPDMDSFPTAQAKYQKALGEFTALAKKYPRTKAASIALYHQGVCQAQLGDEAGALKSLEEASHASDREIASLAQLAQAGELARTGKLPAAVKIYQSLADHPTVTVPRATALLEMAEAYRSTQPAQARQIYDRLQKEFASDLTIAQAIRQNAANLPK